MARFWLHKVSLALSGGSGSSTILDASGATALGVSFQVESHTLQSPDVCQIVVRNPSPQTAMAVQKEFTELTLSAGYEEGNFGQVFTGSIVETQYGERADSFTTTLLRIWCANSDLAYNQSKVNTTLAAGYKPQDVVDTCLKAMQAAQPGFSMGQVVGVDLSQPAFSRGTTLTGMARDHLRELCLTKNATFTLSGNQLGIYARDANPPGDGIVLSPTTGLAGQVIQRPEGVIVQCLLNPQITVNSIVMIDAPIISPSINGSPVIPGLTDRQVQLANQLSSSGRYRVLHLTIDFDTRGGEGTMTLTTIGVGQPLNTVQASLNYDPGTQSAGLGFN